MKNVKIILFAVAASLLFSCDDAIDIIQPGELSPEAAFQTVDDLNKGLTAVYGAIPGEDEIGFTSVFTDEVRIGYGNGGQGIIGGEYAFALTNQSGDAYTIWLNNYALINFANRVIKGAETVIPADADEEALYKDILAQAHILRAWGHFKLLCYFSTDITDDNALGVIKVDFVPLTTQNLPRNTNGEVFELINSDLAYVSDLGANATNIDRKFISADFVKAFRARMASYREDYATALTLSDELITAYPLTSRAQYPNIWKDTPVTGNDEVIFRLDRVLGDTKVGNIWASVNATLTGSPFYEISTDLLALLSLNGDVRLGSFVTPGSTTVKPIAKYTGSGGTALLNDLKIFRTSEMVFIKAEAQAAAGDFPAVAATLQKINAARYTSATAPVIPVPATAEAAYAEILKQRRIELCFEGHRYLDLKHLGPKAGVDINRDPNDCSFNGACFLSSTDYRFTLPIPSDELGANPAIRDQQNPGY